MCPYTEQRGEGPDENGLQGNEHDHDNFLSVVKGGSQ